VVFVLILLQDNDATISLKEMKDSVAAIFKVCERQHKQAAAQPHRQF
jgi:hypothetical protein